MFEVQSIVGKGAQHTVGEIEDGRLIKFPHWKGFWDKSTPETVKRDLEILEEYEIPIPETEVVEKPEIDTGKSIIKPPYIIIAERIQGEIFRELYLENPGVTDQMIHITKQSLEIRKRTEAAVDFLGGEVLKQFIKYLLKEKTPGKLGAYNIMCDTRNRVILIDTNLLDPKRVRLGLKNILRILIDIHHTLLTKLLKNKELFTECLETNTSELITQLSVMLYSYSRKIEAKRM